MDSNPSKTLSPGLQRLLKYRRLLITAAFLLLLLAAFELSGLRQHFTLAFLQEKLAENQLTGLLIFTLLFSLGNLIQIPGWLFLGAAVLALGEALGGVATYVAATLSCIVTFFTIRWLGGDALRELDNRFAKKIIAKLDTYPLRSVILLRTLLQTAPVLNYALAMSGLRFRNYLLGTLIGLPLPIAAYCLFFERIAALIHLR